MSKISGSILLTVFLTALGASSKFSSAESSQQIVDTSPKAMKILVRTALENDEKASGQNHTKEIYLVRRETAKGTQVKENIETETIAISRLIEINGKPLNESQRAEEDQRLNELISNPEAQRKKLKEEHQDDENAMKIFRALPDAFIFEYQGIFPGPSGEIVRMTFSPDPAWEPTSREVQVLTGMNGIIEIDQHDKRLVKIDGHLFRDVDFGWGILGRLFKGGWFLIEQSKINEHRWETTHMILDLTGKALVFKSLVYKEEEKSWGYRQVPPNLTVAQGVERLRQAETELAQTLRNSDSTQKQ